MKRLFIFLLLVSVIFSSYGDSQLVIERIWVIEGAENDTVDFRGAIAVNGSNQQVLAIFTEPQMELEQDGDGVVWLLYKGKINSSEFVLNGTAKVALNYDTHILSDPPLSRRNLSFTNLTKANQKIYQQADSLAEENSSLATIANIVNWIHQTITYDVAYWAEVKSAEEVFEQKRGVCVEYTHLLISMLRSLGFETRYVSGYVFADSWQPHAWAEVYVPDYGWLPVDATFGQVGILDNSHIAMDYGKDQSFVFDLLITQKENVTLTVMDKVSVDFLSEELQTASLDIEFDSTTYFVDVVIDNNRSEYRFGSYVLTIPLYYGKSESYVLLLEPYETVHLYQGLNRSLFERGYSYSVPVLASFNDAKDEKIIEIKGEIDLDAERPALAELFEQCLAPALLLGVLLLRAII